MKKFLLIAAAAVAFATSANAQIPVGEGQLSGAFESNNIFFMSDKMMDQVDPAFSDRKNGNFGSHDYLKLDYSLGRLSAGIQFDGYLPAIHGYDITLYQQRDSKVTAFFTKYVQWEDNNWGVRVGDIYDQFGNGLILRTYEDRNLAFNNSLAGARAHYNFNNYVTIKALAGSPRLYDVRSGNWVFGADASVSISDIVGWYDGLISVEGSYVGRYQDDAGKRLQMQGAPATNLLNMASGRVNFEYAGFSLRGEYAAKLNEDFYDPWLEPKKGNVIFVDLGYTYKRFSATATFRRMDGMVTFIDTNKTGGGNVINYLPMLTRQHTYMLTNLEPHQPSLTGGEIGGQLDLYYSLRNKKDRAKYWNFHANISISNNLKTELWKSHLIWMDISADVERQWNRKLKTSILYSRQERDHSHGYSNDSSHNYVSHIFVADVTYKFNKKHSIRVEAQYLTTKDAEGDWVAGLIEYNIAPMFSVYVSDMWNCGKGIYNFETRGYERLHYYQAGASFTYGRYRAQLSYGRNRKGMVCSGGVCREQPAYTGFNLALTASF